MIILGTCLCIAMSSMSFVFAMAYKQGLQCLQCILTFRVGGTLLLQLFIKFLAIETTVLLRIIQDPMCLLRFIQMLISRLCFDTTMSSVVQKYFLIVSVILQSIRMIQRLVEFMQFLSTKQQQHGQMMLTFSIYGIRDMPLFFVSKIGVMFKYLITLMF